ncbi:MAG: T9SS type A sorting domain-containing protein [Bacteroidetes bacterium]|nr:T9SS type A sorting domain-containing protein [Bacteroidota bacterium]
MKQLFLIIAVVISTIYTASAQQFKWVKGGGSKDVSQNSIDEERVVNMCIDEKGNIYTLSMIDDIDLRADTFYMNKATYVGSSYPLEHLLLSSYTCGGVMRFASLIESKQGTFGYGLAYDNGSLYITALMNGQPKRFGYDATTTTPALANMSLIKYDTLGKYKWSRFVGPDVLASIGFGYNSVAIDGSGNIHQFNTMRSGVQITGSITSTWGTYDLKYDPSGNLLSVTKLLGIDSSYIIVNAIIDKSSNICYALFDNQDGTVRSQYNLAAFNTNGSLIWKDTLNPRTAIGNFRLGKDGYIYVTGGGQGGKVFSLGGLSIADTAYPTKTYATISKLDLNGKTKWTKIVTGVTNSNVALTDISVLPDNSLATVGYVGGVQKYYTDSLVSTPSEGQNPMYFNIDTTGLLIDWKELNGTGFYDMGWCITSDKIGNVYIGGNLSTDMTAKGITTPYNSNGGDKDFFTMKYGYDCDCTAPAFPTASFNYTIVDSAARKVKFTYTGTSPKDSIIWQLGDGTIKKADTFTYQYSAVDTYTVCLRVNVHCGRKKICKDIIVPFKDGGGNSVAFLLGNKNIEVYPNPANEKLYINGADNNTTIVLYDMMGKTVYKSISSSDHETIDIGGMANGNYILLLRDNNGNRASKRIVKQ